MVLLDSLSLVLKELGHAALVPLVLSTLPEPAIAAPSIPRFRYEPRALEQRQQDTSASPDKAPSLTSILVPVIVGVTVVAIVIFLTFRERRKRLEGRHQRVSSRETTDQGTANADSERRREAAERYRRRQLGVPLRSDSGRSIKTLPEYHKDAGSEEIMLFKRHRDESDSGHGTTERHPLVGPELQMLSIPEGDQADVGAYFLEHRRSVSWGRAPPYVGNQDSDAMTAAQPPIPDSPPPPITPLPSEPGHSTVPSRQGSSVGDRLSTLVSIGRLGSLTGRTSRVEEVSAPSSQDGAPSGSNAGSESCLPQSAEPQPNQPNRSVGSIHAVGRSQRGYRSIPSSPVGDSPISPTGDTLHRAASLANARLTRAWGVGTRAVAQLMEVSSQTLSDPDSDSERQTLVAHETAPGKSTFPLSLKTPTREEGMTVYNTKLEPASSSVPQPTPSPRQAPNLGQTPSPETQHPSRRTQQGLQPDMGIHDNQSMEMLSPTPASSRPTSYSVHMPLVPASAVTRAVPGHPSNPTRASPSVNGHLSQAKHAVSRLDSSSVAEAVIDAPDRPRTAPPRKPSPAIEQVRAPRRSSTLKTTTSSAQPSYSSTGPPANAFSFQADSKSVAATVERQPELSTSRTSDLQVEPIASTRSGLTDATGSASRPQPWGYV